ncbi:MAG: HPr(Ser) kinase/phosphatase, partial [Elusimicrobiaceae bacterium]
IIGRGEYAFCAKQPRRLIEKNIMRMLKGSDTPCLVLTGGLKPTPVLTEACDKTGVPLLSTSHDTATFIKKLNAYLEDRLAPDTRLHGVLVNVYGIGVLIQGGAGIGKSECALELVKRGHRLVADDIVEIERRRGDVLFGNCPVILKHYMEVRGLGIIDMELLFGIGSVMDTSRIEMEVRLLPADKQTYCDRTGLEQSSSVILGVSIPSICIPVTPGRNLAVLIEVAALNHRLKEQGIFAAKEFNRKLIGSMAALKKKNATKTE